MKRFELDRLPVHFIIKTGQLNGIQDRQMESLSKRILETLKISSVLP